MYFIYVDDTGDPGNNTIQSTHFGLVGLVLHANYWTDYLGELIEFRRRMRLWCGLKMREEIHATDFISKPGKLKRIKKWKRLEVLWLHLSQLSTMKMFRVVGVLIDKRGKSQDYPIFETAWSALIQRFENTMSSNNFPGPLVRGKGGIVISDNTNIGAVRGRMRRMRRYNPIPKKGGRGYNNSPIELVWEDPNQRNSFFSYFIQAADTAAYFLYQSVDPNGYIRKKSARNYYQILKSVFCAHCSPNDPWGVVRI